jgi:hypothetical protein
LVNAVNSKHIFSKIDTDSGDGHNESSGSMFIL